MRIPKLGLVAFSLAIFTAAIPAHAAFHLMQIEQVIGGVVNGTNADTSAQAIQLRMRFPGENLVSNARLLARDAAGSNAIVIRDLDVNMPNSASGDHVLIVSSNFLNYLPPGITPDFVLTQPIPASYLAAGQLTYEDDFGTIYWSLSWGGANFTGSTTGNIADDADGNFGPPFGTPLPSNSFQALKFTGVATAQSTSNVADYALSASPATFANNARQAFTIFVRPAITVINQELNNLRVTWTTSPGRTNALQRVAGNPDLGLSTNFTDVFILTNAPGSITNFLDIGAITNSTSGYYRARVVP